MYYKGEEGFTIGERCLHYSGKPKVLFDPVKVRVESFIGLRSNPMTSTFYNFPHEVRRMESIVPI